ncbi:MAG: S8 family serine peptidase, partial [Planctomycetota bacterium]
MGRIRKRRRRCRVESLESRHLLAAELLPFGDPVWKSVDSADWLKAEPVEDAVFSTHHYFDNGKRVAMVVLSDRMAVRWNDAPFPALPRTFRELRRAGDTNVVIYAVPNQVAIGPNVQDMVRGLDAFLGEVPVFQIDVTKSEAVVLDEIIVSLKPGVDAEAYFESHEIIVSAKRLSGTPNQYVATVRGGHGVAALEAANLLDAQDRNLEWSTPNLYQNWQRTAVPNDPFYAGQWHLNNTGQSGAAVGEDSSLEAAWDVNFGGSADILVGVIDDGVSVNHPDLLNYAIPGEIPGDGIDNDGNGWIDDVNGWNFVNKNNDSGSGPQDPHGTSVAGVAAARGNNGIGVAAPAFNSPVISGRIFASGSVASDANIAASIYYMAGRTEDGTGTWRSADVVNNSWGGGGPSSAIQGALQWANANGREGEGTLYLFASG